MNALATPEQASQILIARRKTLGLSQADMARQLGISQSRYSEIEAAPERITLERLIAMSSVLGLEFAIREKSSSSQTSEW